MDEKIKDIEEISPELLEAVSGGIKGSGDPAGTLNAMMMWLKRDGDSAEYIINYARSQWMRDGTFYGWNAEQVETYIRENYDRI